ncbi:MAG: cyclic nucleotide-binding protein [Solirubrobacterales bacterium]|jgi:CRP/FNR family cyclic AMP-dependent transcriptional regulator|nr:cyclic nucleotide-binding protein [Solirubrobacterales bacterium]
MDPEPLRSLPLFADLSDEELRRLAPFAREVVVHPGHPLVKQGAFSYEFFVIEDGTAEVLRDGEHVADLGPGDFFGEIGLLEKELRTADVVAKSDMHLVTMDRWDLRRLGKNSPQVVETIRAVLEQRKAAP